jgi:hypothetical protein
MVNLIEIIQKSDEKDWYNIRPLKIYGGIYEIQQKNYARYL